MAANDRTLADNAGQYDDWIEIYNEGDFPVDLGGLYLTDDFSNPAQWQIPSTYPDSTTVQPGHFLLLWADGEVAEGVLHAGFKLNASGEQIALVNITPNGVVFVDSISYDKQTNDISYGRVRDGASSWKNFSTPTPGFSNNLLKIFSQAESLTIPKYFAVYQNYPNPFNPSTTIAFYLPFASKVTVDIFDVTGRRVARLLHEEKQAGHYQIEWQGIDDNGRVVTSGVYFYKITAGGSMTSVRKMVLIR